jgi:hypothetical protein
VSIDTTNSRTTDRDGIRLIEKIVSGGQTGVDRAALDVSLELGISCGGWCPKGRLAEDGPIDERYPLEETTSEDYSQKTKQNVRDSEGTLILTVGKPTGGTALTKTHAETIGKPCLVMNLNQKPNAATFHDWIQTHRIQILNIAGPRSSQQPKIYKKTTQFLNDLFHSNP